MDINRRFEHFTDRELLRLHAALNYYHYHRYADAMGRALLNSTMEELAYREELEREKANP